MKSANTLRERGIVMMGKAFRKRKSGPATKTQPPTDTEGGTR